MPRIVGVDIPNDKRVVIALTYVHGIGPHLSVEVLKQAGIDENARAKDLTEDEISRIASIIDRSYVVEGQLRRQITQYIARLRDIQSYRGMRHRRGMPVRGQRTRTNARTRKGKKKTVAGKRGVKDLRS